jgi:hypothetical protein
VCEDALADFTEVHAQWARWGMDQTGVHMNLVVGRACRMVALSEAIPKDAAFARQLRRKHVPEASQ